MTRLAHLIAAYVKQTLHLLRHPSHRAIGHYVAEPPKFSHQTRWIGCDCGRGFWGKRFPILLIMLMSGVCFGDVRVVTSSAPTTVSINDNDDVVVQVSFIECLPESTATVTTPMVRVSTGPFIMKASSGDCYRSEYINSNGTMPKSPLDWVPCP